jgi:hypothetical protein
VDVLFKNVKAINLPMVIDGLRVELAHTGTSRELVGSFSALELGDGRIYHVYGRNLQGHVVAGSLTHVEDDGEYHAPSRLIQELGSA